MKNLNFKEKLQEKLKELQENRVDEVKGWECVLKSSPYIDNDKIYYSMFYYGIDTIALTDVTVEYIEGEWVSKEKNIFASRTNAITPRQHHREVLRANKYLKDI